MNTDDTQFLTRLFEAAVAAADPKEALAAHMPKRPKGRTVVVGAGKGSAQMAAAFEDLWGEPVEGLVVTRYGYGAPTRNIRVVEAAHPVPDQAGLYAAQELLATVAGLTTDDLVVALICGGGSALLPAPLPGLTLGDEQSLNRALLASGAPISAMNAVRKLVSQIKGGRLAAAAFPARVATFLVSDVPGDNPAQIASGPTVPDTVTGADAERLIAAFGIELPDRISNFLKTAPDAPNPDDAVFADNAVTVIASATFSLEAAAAKARSLGIAAVILSDAIEGEARSVGHVHAAITKEVAYRDRPFTKPVVMLSGGETTVTIRDAHGRGGRNAEFLLAFAGGIESLDIAALAADTDGIDGSELNAGAFADGTTWARLRAIGQDPGALLAGHDAWTAFNLLGNLFEPGPTGTNVNDFRAILIR